MILMAGFYWDPVFDNLPLTDLIMFLLAMPVIYHLTHDLFVKDKFVSEELRNLAMELNVIFVTASQLNRGAVEEIEFDHSHIAGGLSKIQTADNVSLIK